MALVLSDFVKVNCATTGTGTYTLGTTVAGFQSFAAIGNANTCYYSATDGVNWEVGYGTYTSAGTTLARTAIVASSNAGAAVNWTGPTSIAVVFPAEVLKQTIVLSANYTLVSQTAAQALFNASTNGAITLPIGTYRFKCNFVLASTSTSANIGFALGGTATFNQSWLATAQKATLNNQTAGLATMSYNTAANAAIALSSGVATGYAFIDGVIRVTVAGTVIPQVSMSVAAAAVVQANSFCEFERIGSSTETLIGPNWS